MSAEHERAIVREMNECTDEIENAVERIRNLARDLVVDVAGLDSEQLGLLFKQIRRNLETAETHLATRDLKVAYLAGYMHREDPE